MTKDIIFHLGPRKCGKSLFVEKELEVFKEKVYIGTLPSEKEYLETIVEHKERRGFGWKTFEVTTSFDEDLIAIANYFDNKDVSACMVDGVITWYKTLAGKSNKPLNVQRFTNQLVTLICSYNLSWYIVDVNAEIFAGVDVRWKDYKYIHDNFIKCLDITTIIDWRYE